jgi:hypothetical protein
LKECLNVQYDGNDLPALKYLNPKLFPLKSTLQISNPTRVGLKGVDEREE